ncbi:hypothetical protein FBU30_003853 [Linnemannia zychae]|nr:hypothetical protein FBU30_003853 [Linnemannia zychae]
MSPEEAEIKTMPVGSSKPLHKVGGDQRVDVTVVDMSQTEYKVGTDMTNEQFLEWLKLPVNIHHLAVEDLLHVPQRTKVDMYSKQTYISCTLLTLLEQLGDGESRQVDPYPVTHEVDPDIFKKRLPLEQLDSCKNYHYAEEQNYDSLHVEMEQVTLLLLEGGTLLTLFQVSGRTVVAPIVERLSHSYSLVRKHGDASFLLQSVIDGIVDHALPIVDALRFEIDEVNIRVLALPSMSCTKTLNQLTAHLSMLRRTLDPTQKLVHALLGQDERSPLSPLARTYMGDVMDHCKTMVEDIDTMLNLCERLINMIFNLITYDTNETMRRLTLVTILFLPITFVAGVYGTNFRIFPELDHDIAYFWTICGVIFAVFVILIVGEWLLSRWKAKRIEMRLKSRDPNRLGRISFS